jgi:hypothetical protein
MGGWDQNISWGDWLGSVDWIQLAQDRDRWRAVVNTAMDLGFCRQRVRQLASSVVSVCGDY